MRHESIYDQLAAIKQIGSIEDYITSFECLIAQVPRIPDEQYFSYFTQGLKNEIRARIRSLHVAHPLSRGRMMNVARAIDVKISGRNKIWQGRGEFRGDRSQVVHRPISTVIKRTSPSASGLLRSQLPQSPPFHPPPKNPSLDSFLATDGLD
ncbi:hypothetical protein V8G54_023512 [Vigna mungo]|uniref:Retrotransposon gag domain-containing protein n=1 Tax=Vigna mungo TaxID=3915 RepID=A0AAQ3N5I5_VIGMU